MLKKYKVKFDAHDKVHKVDILATSKCAHNLSKVKYRTVSNTACGKKLKNNPKWLAVRDF